MVIFLQVVMMVPVEKQKLKLLYQHEILQIIYYLVALPEIALIAKNIMMRISLH